jgi:hypothetical protein
VNLAKWPIRGWPGLDFVGFSARFDTDALWESKMACWKIHENSLSMGGHIYIYNMCVYIILGK